jgi:hypothetical protein
MRLRVFLPSAAAIIVSLYFCFTILPASKNTNNQLASDARVELSFQTNTAIENYSHEPHRKDLFTPAVKSQAVAEMEPAERSTTMAIIKQGSAEDSQSIINNLLISSINNDLKSFEFIKSQLTNADGAIRQAARDAIVQFGDASAAPLLRELADRTPSSEEKISLITAADFLETPRLQIAPNNK